MTLEEMEKSDKPFLLPTDIAEVLGCTPQGIRVIARVDPRRLGFPVIVIGNRTKIPRIPFLNFMEGK